MKRSFSFVFEPPAGWREFGNGVALGFLGPHGEELLVSGKSIVGQGTQVEVDAVLKRLRSNALDAMRQTVEEGSLVVSKPLYESTNEAGLKVWSTCAKTRDGRAVFAQALLVAQTGVLFVTFEAVDRPDAMLIFDQFIGGIDEAIESERTT